MNAKINKRSARMSSKKVSISNNTKELTRQAGLVAVVTFQPQYGMIGLINETVRHDRGANALYDSVDALFLIVIAIKSAAFTLEITGKDTIILQAPDDKVY